MLWRWLFARDCLLILAVWDSHILLKYVDKLRVTMKNPIIFYVGKGESLNDATCMTCTLVGTTVATKTFLTRSFPPKCSKYMSWNMCLPWLARHLKAFQKFQPTLETIKMVTDGTKDSDRSIVLYFWVICDSQYFYSVPSQNISFAFLGFFFTIFLFIIIFTKSEERKCIRGNSFNGFHRKIKLGAVKLR